MLNFNDWQALFSGDEISKYKEHLAEIHTIIVNSKQLIGLTKEEITEVFARFKFEPHFIEVSKDNYGFVGAWYAEHVIKVCIDKDTQRVVSLIG